MDCLGCYAATREPAAGIRQRSEYRNWRGSTGRSDPGWAV